ncbi:MAG: DUF4931 domain-containing protein [Niameybacter sp.]|uniref:galactose-1-phosphate uridylyltransferase n=1 Tax=Niameybacter sp. TaxID=2033640 RepID=UPI002FCADED6
MIYNDDVLSISSILSENRQTRPNHFLKASLCPFCLEHADQIETVQKEAMTKEGDHIRIVKNKYPACDEKGMVYGIHDVIIETDDHQKKPWQYGIGHWETLLWVMQERWLDLAAHPRIHFIQIFKNEGERAGASISHAHSQIIALEEVPCTIETHYKKVEDYGHKLEKCRLCEEVASGIWRIFTEEGWEIAVPEGMALPDETWIMPQKHINHIGELTKQDRLALAKLIHTVLNVYHKWLGDISYNLCIMGGRPKSDTHYHFFVKLLPRTGNFAGFELATGCTINMVSAKTQRAMMHKMILDLEGE